MAPVQILLNNLLHDFSQITIPSHNVEDETVAIRYSDLRAAAIFLSGRRSVVPNRLVHIIRSRYNIIKSRASRWLTLSTVGVALVGFIIPYTPLGTFFGFTPLPIGAICGLILCYLILIDFVKRWFFTQYGW